MTDKKILRATLRNLRKSVENKKLFPTDAIPPVLMAAFSRADIVAGYVKAGSEVDPGPLLVRAQTLGARTALPALADRAATEIEFRLWAPDEPLVPAPFSFLQPLPEAPRCSPGLILTPLLGFDRAMNRLGQGGGHYDRAFTAHPHALRVGIAWSIQECKALPVEPWDIPLDAVWTEKEWIVGPQSRIARA